MELVEVGPHTLYKGDCLEVIPSLDSESVDLVLTDLPYGLTSNKWDSIIDLDRLWYGLLQITKPVSAILFTASQPFTSRLVMSKPELFKHEWIWIKNRGSNFANTVREPMKEHESVLVFSKGKWTYNKQMQERTGGGSSRIEYNVAFTSKSSNYRDFEGRPENRLPKLRVPSSWQKFNTEVGFHPTQKPVSLMRYLIRTYTNQGDTVLDCTMGSGTTGVAAELEGCAFVGIEIDNKYFEIARGRLQDAVVDSTRVSRA